MHTKVMGSIAGALSDGGDYEAGLAENLAEAVTTYLKRNYGCGPVSSDEIHSMIEAVLSDTGYEDAALTLHESRILRQIRRSRLEVLHTNTLNSIEALQFDPIEASATSPWNKSVIVHDLETKAGLAHSLARVVAGSTEEKVLGLGIRRVTSTLIRAIVLNELLAVQQAEKALAQQPVQPARPTSPDFTTKADRKQLPIAAMAR